MTEQEWRASDDPQAMLQTLERWRTDYPDTQWHVSARKLRLFACASARLRWASLTDARAREAVGSAELFADGNTPPNFRGVAFNKTDNIFEGFQRFQAQCCLRADAADGAVEITGAVVSRGVWPAQAAQLREVVGNPFRPVTLKKQVFRHCPRCGGSGKKWRKGAIEVGGDTLSRLGEMVDCVWCTGTGSRAETVAPAWLTPQVLTLAQAAYAEREPECRLCKGAGYIDRPVICGPNTSEDEMRRVADEAGGPIPCPSCRGKNHDGSLDPVRLGILSDALEEAGCTDGAILSHLRGDKERVHGGTRLDGVLISNPEAYYLRSPGVHVRGCWALDLILGKS